MLSSSYSETPGEVGPIWSSAMGGGEGSRGDEAGERAAAAMLGGGVEGRGEVWDGGGPRMLAVRLINIGFAGGVKVSGEDGCAARSMSLSQTLPHAGTGTGTVLQRRRSCCRRARMNETPLLL